MSRKSTIPVSDEIWSMIKETQKSLKEFQKERETDHEKFKAARREFHIAQKELQAGHKEFHIAQKKLQASQKKTDRQIQKIGGRFNERWGALVESLVEGKLVQIFQERGIDITQTYPRPKGAWKKADGQIKRKECDIIVANGTEAVIVEVKTTLTPKDVRDFLETLQNFKRYFTRFDSEIIYGAVAYLATESRADVLAEEEGLFLIRATGDSASLANNESFKPKAFA